MFLLVNCERTKRQQSWLKQPTSSSTPLSLTTCGTTSLAGLKNAAGLFPEMFSTIFVSLVSIILRFVRWKKHHTGFLLLLLWADMKSCFLFRKTASISTNAARHAGSSDPPEPVLVEFCQLVDFLLDIVSLVRIFLFLVFFFLKALKNIVNLFFFLT